MKDQSAALDEPGAGGYRDRIYAQYVSAFKGRPEGPALEASFARHARFLDHLLGPLMRELQPQKMLDIGCGQGRVLFWAGQRGIPHVRGFDRSEEQIAVARSLGLACEVSTAADYLARCDRDFDLIVAMDIVEHFARDEALAFLALCRACLRPGGVLFLTTPNGSALRPGPIVYGDLTHETIFSPPTITLALGLSGFTDIEIFEIRPAPVSVRARMRRLLWQLVRLAPALLDLIEKGSRATLVYTRVMGVVARIPRREPLSHG